MRHCSALTSTPSRILKRYVRLHRPWARLRHIMRFGLLLLSCRGEGL
ncbi:hypothetical protein SVEN_2310 [Streptomyces venezuelae ATCC 10712]|uniref:Uncharacterized protein n=1 Tax=Streptomyces venezuelae (strain ATCC 10712 / CBS 650.69 / DSM 40230 / JCM 4526 / NBRC 13096 / PD 04745) TaxID=953739 RepID=F2R247_STRVP|nr:hypothetical protein SVEN_2310 [Streptomyces venezuelae ATCC 10712]